LEFVFEKISFPVGRVESLTIQPLSFDEFLNATGREMLTRLRPSLSTGLRNQQLSAAAHLKLSEALREYIAIGGMPEVVRSFIETKSILQARKLQTELIKNFRDDVPKYTKGNLQVDNIWKVWQRIPRFLGQEIKYSTLGEGDPAARTSKSVELLTQAQLCKLVSWTSAAQLPFAANSNDKHFKLAHLDIGLYGAVSGLNLQSLLRPASSEEKDLISIYEGRLAEQLIAQIICSDSPSASEDGRLYYWSRTGQGGNAEIDFLLSRRGEIIPIEVKNGSAGKLRSLKVFLEEHPKIKTGIVLRDVDRIAQLASSKCIEAPLYTRLD
jgi:predicted AAA+ superfamily ATPase